MKKGKPIQYIIGHTYSSGLKFKVSKKVLIPRWETENLVNDAIKYISDHFENPKILDIGTGSGLIAITLFKNLENADIVAIDISRGALKTARENAKTNNAKINFKRSNLFKKIDGKFDVIISNPPYIDKNEEVEEKVLKNEPKIALFAKNKGLYFYEEILKDANKYLNEKNMIIFEIGKDQNNDIKILAKTYFPNAKIISKKDLIDNDRYIFIIND